MGEIVNLRRARKVRDKRSKETEAEANRIAHGRTKAERELGEATARLETEKLDAHRLEAPQSEPE
ncbi:hypothetical protein A1351_03860 [Methylosinus sp. R-45379]|jgi:hypothetical protein|uniref:DUF4169 family protein n=1 Tax=unclassified Methylosinus TaxID=2624500 RepID=UPI0004638A5E|nr:MULTISPECIES: DUF4169 family protein [unclassified Methylosinus]OAI22638.1 hypothetical protein A1351_03860 [Methylosinus sp. R-45379]